MTRNIALLSDFGLEQHYVGVMKGVILKINPDAGIIDISHGLDNHNLLQAAFMLQNSFNYFPAGCVFLVVVDPGVGSRRKAIAVRTRHYYFVGPDNGVLSLAAKKDTLKNAVSLKREDYFLKSVSATFHGRDIFAPVAAYLSKGVPMDSFGPPVSQIKKVDFPSVKATKNLIKGNVIYADKFGNLVTNIKNIQLERRLKKSSGIEARLNDRIIEDIYVSYFRAKKESPFFVMGSSGYLEISLKADSAKDFFNYLRGSFPIITVRIT
ncbi:MAG: hypothetical protein GF375_06700 [Candidatus Omnitrophica bacterium]|nr:hypothetical protein [Candidatus Omnitrophota bacterium]MBD3269663.1 hypothetical protein [Candidatus Omnitrophota bacterium]